MPIANADDVSVVLGRPLASEAETRQVEWWLRNVEMMIRTRVGDLTLLDPEALVYVEAESVAAKVKRKAAAESSISVTVDDSTVTRRYENAVTDEDITEDWWALLGVKPLPKAVSMRVGGGWLLR